MLELAKSTVSLTWAMSLLGAKQFAEVFTGSTGATARTREAFDAKAQGAGRNLGGKLGELFRCQSLAKLADA